MTPLMWLLCALAIPVALAVDAILDEDKRAAVGRWRRTRRIEARRAYFGSGGYRPRPSALPKSPPRGGTMGVPPRPWMSVNPRTVRPPKGPTAVTHPRGGQSSTALLAHVRAAKAGARRPAPNQTKPRTIRGM